MRPIGFTFSIHAHIAVFISAFSDFKKDPFTYISGLKSIPIYLKKYADFITIFIKSAFFHRNRGVFPFLGKCKYQDK